MTVDTLKLFSPKEALPLLVVGSSLAIGHISSADAATLYAVTGDGGSPSETLFTIDTTTAAATPVLTLGAGSDGEAIGFNPTDGRMYHVSGISDGNRFWESIDLSVPTVTTSVPLVMPNENLALTWNPSTNSFLMTNRDRNLYSITASGVPTALGATPYLKGLAFVGSTLYGADQSSTALYNLNPSTGAVNSSVSVSLPSFSISGMNGLATDPDSGTLYGLLRVSGGDRRLATIDPLTGIATDIGLVSGGTGWAGLAFAESTVAVPEPNTFLATSSICLLGLLTGRRRLR